MKITSIEPVVLRVDGAGRNTLLKGGWVFLRVHTDEGVTGMGEASHSSDDRLAVTYAAAIESRIRGRSPFDILALRSEMRRMDSGRIARTAAGAVEQALWDIRGRTLGVPINALFGGRLRDRLRLYANINRSLADRTPEGFARHAEAAVADGFRAVKIAPFDELDDRARVRSGRDAAWRKGVARAAAVRAAVGPSVELAIDCHGRMEASEAIEAGKALAELDLLWYEEPVGDAHPGDLARVRRAVNVTVASGEHLFGVAGFKPLLVDRVVDVLMPDVKHCGGLLDCRAIADAALANDLLVAPHNPSGPVASAATAHVVAGLSNFLILEHAWAEVPWRAELLDPPERVVDGYLELPQGPGLGHVLSDKVAAAHRAA